jgi:hypothetical protein
MDLERCKNALYSRDLCFSQWTPELTKDFLTADLGHNPGLFLIKFPQRLSADSGAFPWNRAEMDFTFSWTRVLVESLLFGHGSTIEIYWIWVSNILLKLSWFCIATMKLSILELMFSRRLSMAWILLPKYSLIFSWSLTISLREGSFLLKVYPLTPCWQLSKGKLGIFHPKLKPWFGQKPLLEFPTKLTS